MSLCEGSWASDPWAASDVPTILQRRAAPVPLAPWFNYLKSIPQREGVEALDGTHVRHDEVRRRDSS